MVLVVACSAGESGGPVDGPAYPSVVYVPTPSSPIVGAPNFDVASVRAVLGAWVAPSQRPDQPPRLELLHYPWVPLEGVFTYELHEPCAVAVGSYEVDGVLIEFTEVSRSSLRCDVLSDSSETGFDITSARTWSIDGDQLTITNLADESLVLRRPEADQQPHEPQTLSPQVGLVDATGFALHLGTQSQNADRPGTAPVNWVAWSPGEGTGPADPFTWEAQRFKTQSTTRIVRENMTDRCAVAHLQTDEYRRPISVRRLPYSHLQLIAQWPSVPDTLTSGHASGLVGVVFLDCDVSRDSVAAFGVAEGVTADWQLVHFGATFADPVVVAGPPSFNGGDPGVIEIRNVTYRSFEMRFREWDYLDGAHPTAETVPFLVVERGSTVLPSGGVIEAGTAVGETSPREVAFTSFFDAVPVVLATVVHFPASIQ